MPLSHKKNPTFCSLSQTNQRNASVLKLNFLKIQFQMYNSIFETSRYSEHGLRKKNFGTQVPCKVLKSMELEFHWNFFNELEYFTWNLELEFQKKKNFNFQFVITRLSKNRVSKQGHFPIQFWKWDKMLDFFLKKGQKPIFSYIER